MRLIDFDKALKIAERYGTAHGTTIGRHSGVADVIHYELSHLPVIKAEPVRHGKWNDVCCAVKCSKCHEEYSDEIFLMRGNINYCPNCGAKMDGGISNGNDE